MFEINEKEMIDNILIENNIKDGFVNPPKLSDLNSDYMNARESHIAAVEKIDEWLRIFESKNKSKLKNRSNTTSKIVKKNAKWTYPTIEEPILSHKDIITLEPRTFEDKKAAILNQIIIRYQLENDINFTKFVNESTRDFVNKGTLIVKVGWNRKKEKIKKVVPIYEDQEVLNEYGMPVIEKVKIGTKIEENYEVIKNHPKIEILNYKKVIIDPTAKGDISKAQFVIYQYETNLSNLRKEGIYSNLDFIDTKSGSKFNDIDDDISFDFKDEARKRLVVREYWGYWDIYGTGTTEMIVCTYVDNVIIGLEVNPLPFSELPFEIAHFEPVDQSNYGEPDAEILKEYQQNITASTRAVIDVTARVAAGQQARPINWLDPVNKRKFENGEDYEYNPFMPPKEALHLHTPGEVPRGIWDFIAQQSNEAVELAGRKPFNIGQSGSATTATAIRSHMDATSKRDMGILRRYTKLLESMVKKMIALNRIYLSDGQIFRITNDKYLAINREFLYGEFDIKIRVTTPEEVENKVNKKNFLLQTLGNTIPFEITQKLLASISRLEDDPELAHDIEEYKPQPDPLKIEEQKLKNELLKAQIEVYKSSVIENQSDAGLNQAKAQEAIRKAEKLKAEADALDLEFIQKSDGIDHERELEKQQQKINSQIDLKQLEAILGRNK